MNIKLLPLLFLPFAYSPAALLVYEGFDYGTSGAINGTVATGTGLTGSYSSAITVGAGGSGSANKTTGLTFSSNFHPTSGGALQVSLTTASSSGVDVVTSGVQFSAGTHTGTIYSSYLFNLSASTIDTSTDQIGTRVSSAQTTSSSSRFGMFGDSGNSANNMAVTYASSTSSQTGTSGNLVLELNTTYLMIGQWTNVGTAGGGTATMWYLTSSQYDSWQTLGGGTLASLDTYANGKTQRAETTQINFDNSSYLQFLVSEAGPTAVGTMTGTFDEVRYATDFAAVTVPEPSSSLLLGLGAFVAVRLARRSRGSAC